jgi:hypothetical protein
MLSVIMLSVVMLNVVAPQNDRKKFYQKVKTSFQKVSSHIFNQKFWQSARFYKDFLRHGASKGPGKLT